MNIPLHLHAPGSSIRSIHHELPRGRLKGKGVSTLTNNLSAYMHKLLIPLGTGTDQDQYITNCQW